MALSLEGNKMPELTVKERITNFKEVRLGFDEETAQKEAARCLQCKIPQCQKGCPIHNNIPGFIAKIKEHDYDGALAVLRQTSAYPSVCSRVCAQEQQCEGHCVLGKRGDAVGIGALERFAAEYGKEPEISIKTAADAQRVAVVGSGPAGMAAADSLVQKGYKVTIFEALSEAGGLLSYGIPEFRLPKETIVQKEIDRLKSMGVEFVFNAPVGSLYTIDELLTEEGFDAVFVGIGVVEPKYMNIPGEGIAGVYTANDFLARCSLFKAYKFPEYLTPVAIGKRVAVVGGGNVAMDAARTAWRMGAEKVYVVYRRSEAELPAFRDEVESAKEEGTEFHLLNNPVEVLGDEEGKVRALRCIRMELGEPDESGRRRPVPVEGSEFELPVETVIMAIGQKASPQLMNATPDLKVAKWGTIEAEEGTGITSKPGVFAGGDIVTGPKTVVGAMRQGKEAAEAIDKYLQEKRK